MLSDFQSAVQFISAIYVTIVSTKLSELMYNVHKNIDTLLIPINDPQIFTELLSDQDRERIERIKDTVCESVCKRIHRIAFLGVILGIAFLFYSSHFEKFFFATEECPYFWAIYFICLFPALWMVITSKSIIWSIHRLTTLLSKSGLKQNTIALDIARLMSKSGKPYEDLDTNDLTKIIQELDNEVDLLFLTSYILTLSKFDGQYYDAASEFGKKQSNKACKAIIDLYEDKANKGLSLIVLPLRIRWKFRRGKCL